MRQCSGAQLVGHGVSLHLLKGKPVREARPINPADDHTSFQVFHRLFQPECIPLCIALWRPTRKGGQRECAQASSLPDVKEALLRHGIPFVETKVKEGGVMVTQVCGPTRAETLENELQEL